MPTPCSAPGRAGLRLESCMLKEGCTGAGWPGWAKAGGAARRQAKRSPKSSPQRRGGAEKTRRKPKSKPESAEVAEGAEKPGLAARKDSANLGENLNIPV